MAGLSVADIQALVAQFEGVGYEPLGDARGSGEGVSVFTSTEAGDDFHNFRPYGDGDDVRQLDLPTYARTRRLWTRQYSRQRTKTLHLALDGSASMGVFGHQKWHAAIRVACVLKSMCLRSGHGVVVSVFDDGAWHPVPQTSSGGADLPALSWLNAFRCAGASGLATLSDMPIQAGGEFCLISDFMWSTAIDELKQLNAQTESRLSLIRLSSAADIEVPAAGYVDPESGLRGVVKASERAHLKAGLSAFRGRLEEWARLNGLMCFDWSTDGFVADLSAWLLMRQRYQTAGVV